MTETNDKKHDPNVFDPDKFISAFSGALDQITDTIKFGEEIAKSDIERIFFVGCGAPHFMMRVLAYWVKKYTTSLDIRNFFPAEFIHQDPTAVDQNTLVLLGSHSGTTRETVEAAQFLQGKACKTIAITQEPSSPLGKLVNEVINYGKTSEGYFSSYILGQIFISTILDKLEPNWKLHDALLVSLPHLPNALAEAKLSNLEKATKQANEFANDRIMYVVGGGPMFTTAYTFASCFLMEMQRMHAHPLVAAEFFHGPFEVVDEKTPMVILVGEDPSRPEAKRVVQFCQKYAKRFVVYDSKERAMKNILADVRPIVAPFIIDAALTALVDQFAIVHNHPLTIRRYMGMVEY